MLEKSTKELNEIGKRIEVEFLPSEGHQHCAEDPQYGKIVSFKTDKKDFLRDTVRDVLFYLEDKGIKHEEAHRCQEHLFGISAIIASEQEEKTFLEILDSILENPLEIEKEIIWPLSSKIDGECSLNTFETYEIDSEKRKQMWENRHFHLGGKHTESNKDSHSKYHEFYNKFSFLKIPSSSENPLKTAESLLRNTKVCQEYIQKRNPEEAKEFIESNDRAKAFYILNLNIGELSAKMTIREVEKEIRRINSIGKITSSEIMATEEIDTPFPVLYHEITDNGHYDEFIMNHQIKIPEFSKIPTISASKIEFIDDFYTEIFQKSTSETYQEKVQRALELMNNLNPERTEENIIYVSTVLELLLSKNRDPSFEKISQRGAALFTEVSDDKPIDQVKGKLKGFFDIRHDVIHKGETLPSENYSMKDISEFYSFSRKVTIVLIMNIVEIFEDSETSYQKFLKKLDMKYMESEVEKTTPQNIFDLE